MDITNVIVLFSMLGVNNLPYVFAKVANNWDLLSDADKLSLFNDTNNNTATLAQLQSLGAFKVLSLTDTAVGAPSSVRVSGVSNDVVLLPSKLVCNSANKILSISITEDISDTTNASVRYAITKDLEHYYTLNSGVWTAITPIASNILTDGLSSSDILSITSSVWEDLYAGDSGIALAIAFHETAESQSTEVENVAVTADIKAMWEKAEHTEDYTYGYTPDTLHVDLLKNGSYKINYGSGGGTGSSSGTEYDFATNLDIDNLFI